MKTWEAVCKAVGAQKSITASDKYKAETALAAKRLIERDEAMLRQALEALEDMRHTMLRRYCYCESYDSVIDAIKERLAAAKEAP